MALSACQYCGRQNDAGAQFCSDCGKPLTKAAAARAAVAAGSGGGGAEGGGGGGGGGGLGSRTSGGGRGPGGGARGGRRAGAGPGAGGDWFRARAGGGQARAAVPQRMLPARCAERRPARTDREDSTAASFPTDAPITPSYWFWFPRWPPNWRASSASTPRRRSGAPKAISASWKISFFPRCTPNCRGRKGDSRYATSAAATARGSFSKLPTA